MDLPFFWFLFISLDKERSNGTKETSYASIYFVRTLTFISFTQWDSNKPGANVFGVDPDALNAVWRSFYMWGLVMVFMVLLYRWLVLDTFL